MAVEFRRMQESVAKMLLLLLTAAYRLLYAVYAALVAQFG